MWKEVKEGLVEVGDKLVVKNSLGGVSSYTIDKVGKTFCGSVRPSDGYVYKWKRRICGNMSKPHYTWSTTSYKVFREEV